MNIRNKTLTKKRVESEPAHFFVRSQVDPVVPRWFVDAKYCVCTGIKVLSYYQAGVARSQLT